MKPLMEDEQLKNAARRFGARLDATMRERGVGRDPLCAAAKVTRSTLRQYRAGYNLPSLEVAEKLAKALDDPTLFKIARGGRTKTCEVCKRDFLQEMGRPRRVCYEDRCVAVIRKLTANAGDSRLRADNAERALGLMRDLVSEYAAAVDGFCHECSPEGACPMAKCQLRPLSPLPLATAPRVDVKVAEPLPGQYGTPEARERTIARIREANAARWARPGERERQSELTRRMRADGTIPRNTRAKAS